MALVGCGQESLTLPVLKGVDLVNKDSTAATVKVFDYINGLRERGLVLSGQQVNSYSDGKNKQLEDEHVFSITGKYPALTSYELGHTKYFDSIAKNTVKRATAYWQNGGLVSINWHPDGPINGDEYNTQMSQSDFDKLVTKDTKEYQSWLEQIDKGALYLKQLCDAGVVVLFRPYHEMNGNWFWWGGKTPQSFIKLWENLYDRYTNHHKLNNLIWVWSPGMVGDITDEYYPKGYVDIGGVDVYVNKQDNSYFYNAAKGLSKVMADKTFALTEVGLVPNKAMLQSSGYSWFTIWMNEWCDRDYYGAPPSNGPGNTKSSIEEIYSYDFVITRDELDSFVP